MIGIRRRLHVGALFFVMSCLFVLGAAGDSAAQHWYWYLDNGNGAWGPGDWSRGPFGLCTDMPLGGRWTVNHPDTIWVYRSGMWYVDANTNGVWDPADDSLGPLGMSNDLPVLGDWVLSGYDLLGVFRPSLAYWYLDLNASDTWNGCSVDGCFNFGKSGDIPVSGDWNGDGWTEIGVFRNGLWALDFSGNFRWDGPVQDRLYTFGLAGDIPVTGDWNGDGWTEIGIFRNGLWALDFNGNFRWDGVGPTTDRVYSFGLPTDRPVTGDWNNDGRTEIGVARCPGANRPPALGHLVATWNQLSEGRSAEVRGPGIASVNGVWQFLGLSGPGGAGAGLAQVIDIDANNDGVADLNNPIVLAARGTFRQNTTPTTAVGLPSSITLIVAEGATDPDGDPLTYRWELPTQGGTYYSTGSAGSQFPPGAKITDVSKYNRNSVLYEAPDQQWPVLDSAIFGGLAQIGTTVSDGKAASAPKYIPIEYDRLIQMDLIDIRGTEVDLFGNDGVIDTIELQLFVSLSVARNPAGFIMNNFEPLTDTWFRVMCNDPACPPGDDAIVDLGPAGQVAVNPGSCLTRVTAVRPAGWRNAARVSCFYPLVDRNGFNNGNRGKMTGITVVASSMAPGISAWPFVEIAASQGPPLGDAIPTIDSRGATLADTETVTIDTHASKEQLISVWDSGSAADDSFELIINGYSQGTTPVGGELIFGPGFVGAQGQVGPLTPGTHTLTIKVLKAPDNIGTYSVRLLSGGMQFSGGGTEVSGSPGEGTTTNYTFTVPVTP